MKPSIIPRASTTSLRYARNDVGLNLDCAFENKLRRPSEGDITKPSGNCFKANLQFVTPAGENSDRPVTTFSGTED
jgi:hypothetical protein